MDLEKIKQEALKDLKAIKDMAELELARIKHLGRSSELNTFLRKLKDVAEDQRRDLGKDANQLWADLEKEFAVRSIQVKALANKAQQALFDITRPAAKLPRGHIHPLTQVQDEINAIFAGMGFQVLEGPELESEYNNFDALNIPKDHPARELQDTFWVKGAHGTADARKNFLLRTHTSPMQVRFMETHQPPFRILVPGRVYRNEATDMTHEFQFHQVEGLMVDRQEAANPVSMANLKGVMEYFYRRFFRDDVKVKFVASYFPFTEPSVEVYIQGTKGKLKGKWLEVAGAGMVHQNVFKAAGYAAGEFQGFAFGMALERMAMLKFKIDDIRLFHGGDLRFLKQF